MVNYNMGRYYAWENLSKLIKKTIRKRFHTPTYSFTYIPPKIHTNIHFIPFEEWKASTLPIIEIEIIERASSNTP